MLKKIILPFTKAKEIREKTYEKIKPNDARTEVINTIMHGFLSGALLFAIIKRIFF